MSVAGILIPLAGILKTQRKQKAQIDSNSFKLHYRITTTLLFLCSILVTANNLIGKPIDCVPGSDGLIERVLNQYCWIHSTFSVPPRSAIGLTEKGADNFEEFAYPGVQPHIKNESGDKVYHAYYQWVSIILFFQGVFFYVPHQLWKLLEGEQMSMITDGLLGVTMKIQDREKKESELVDYLYGTWNKHKAYALKYFFCMFLNLINVILQCYLINEFLGGAFMNYGLDYLKWAQADNEDRMDCEDPMIKVFPRLTKCTFHKYGASGTIEAHDSLCVLATNIINEKIYITLWLWFLIIGASTILDLIYTAILILIPPARVLLMDRGSKNLKDAADILKKKANFGDWVIINRLSKNMDNILFDDFMEKFTEKLKTKEPPHANA